MSGHIGVFDSGVGGLTVVRQILKTLPEENIVFLADNEHVPYGDKSREQIISYSLNNTRILSAYDLKALVIACNTSDSLSHQILAENYELPIFGVIAPAVKQAASLTRNKKIAVLATRATILSNEYERQLKKLAEDLEVIPIACPELVPLIEAGSAEQEETRAILAQYLQKTDDADTIILGCTHYDLLMDVLHDLAPEVNIVSSSRCVVHDLKCYLEEAGLLSKEKTGDIYLTSKMTDKLDTVSSLIIPDIAYRKTDA